MPPNDATHSPAPRSGSLRSRTGRGRPYPPEIVEAVRALVQGTALPYPQIAERTGVGRATVETWSRSRGWRGGAEVEPARPGGGRRRPEMREAARALVEGTRLSFAVIGARLGLGTATLWCWQREGGWRRPAPPDRPGPRLPRYRTFSGRPYAADAVQGARNLVTASLLSQDRIAAQLGVSQDSVSRWTRRRGWVRPAAEPGSLRFTCLKRTAPLRESGDRRGRPYAAEVVEAARELYEQTPFSTLVIAARLKVGRDSVIGWARVNGWTRPRDQPDAHGRLPRRRRRLPVS